MWTMAEILLICIPENLCASALNLFKKTQHGDTENTELHRVTQRKIYRAKMKSQKSKI